MASEDQKSHLEKEYKLKRELNLDLTYPQLSALNDIMCDLATNEFKRGLDKGFEIANMYKD